MKLVYNYFSRVVIVDAVGTLHIIGLMMIHFGGSNDTVSDRSIDLG